MRDELKKIYEEENDIWGIPQTYRDLKLYPILMKDSKIKKLLRVLTFPKRYIPEKQIMKMSYFKFIAFVVQSSIDSKGTEIIDNIVELYKYITKTENVVFGYKGDDFNSLSLALKIDDKEYLEYDFDCMREIILEQNGLSVDIIEEYNPDLEGKLNFLQKGFKDITAKDEIFTLSAMLRIPLSEISEYTMYQFKAMMERMSIVNDYAIYRPLEASGQITLKKGEIKHYMAHLERTGRYDSLLIDRDAFMEENKESLYDPNTPQ